MKSSKGDFQANLDNALKKGTFSSETYVTDGQRFGTILLESDYEMTPELAFKTYSSRWEIEVVMRYYKQTCEFDETRVHNDYSVIGSEFCNFLAVIMTYRLIKTFDAANLFKDHTYKRIMQILRRAKRVHLETEWVPTKLTPSEFEVLKSLDLTEGKSV